MNFSLHHLVRQPDIPSDKPPLLILLHGVGSHEYDLFSLAQYVDKRFLVLSARAPQYAWPKQLCLVSSTDSAG